MGITIQEYCIVRRERIKLTSKFAILFIIVGIIPLSLSGFVSYSIYQANIQQLTIDSAVQNVEIKGQDIESLFIDAEFFMKSAEDQRLIFFLESKEETYDVAKELLDVFKLYRTSLDKKQLVENIYILGFNGKCMSERKGLYYKSPDSLRMNPVLKKILDNPNDITILPDHLPDYDKDPQDSNVISMGKILYDYISFEPVGIVLIDLNIEEIKKQYSEYRFFDIGQISLHYGKSAPSGYEFNELTQWNELFNHDSDKISYTIIKDRESQNLFVRYQTRYPDFSILGSIHVDELYLGVRTVRNTTGIFFLISSLLIYIIYLIISNTLMKPLEDIQNKMHEAALGELNISLKPRNWSMIPDLADSFNTMMKDLRSYLKKTDEEHRKYLDAELRVYQAQINPHFLYNTLDTILWSAVDQGNKEIEDLVFDMSQFFRISLSKGAEFISVEDEISCINSYLKIQKVRYASILEFTINVDESMKSCRMLKLLLQPVVENALYHGLKNKRTKGLIEITARKESNILCFEIQDSGIGIEKDNLKLLNKRLEDPREYASLAETGVGILNVQSRIKMKYGKQYGMTIKSKYNYGTTVSIRIPVS